MATRSYQLKGSKARHFTADNAEKLDWVSYPTLLRAVADWIESQKLTDDLIDDLKLRTVFEGHSGDFEDPYYESATLYYRIEE